MTENFQPCRFCVSKDLSITLSVTCNGCGARAAKVFWNTRAAAQADATAIQPQRMPEPDWQDDPSADERWTAGCDFAMLQLCHTLGIDPHTVSWDAATETVDGDVCAVIGNIMRARYGDNWSAALTRPECGDAT